MKGLKKMIAGVFTIAMVVTFVPQINLGVNADTAKKFTYAKYCVGELLNLKGFEF